MINYSPYHCCCSMLPRPPPSSENKFYNNFINWCIKIILFNVNKFFFIFSFDSNAKNELFNDKSLTVSLLRCRPMSPLRPPSHCQQFFKHSRAFAEHVPARAYPNAKIARLIDLWTALPTSQANRTKLIGKSPRCDVSVRVLDDRIYQLGRD